MELVFRWSITIIRIRVEIVPFGNLVILPRGEVIAAHMLATFHRYAA